MPPSPAELRALAERVRTEGPSFFLEQEIGAIRFAGESGPAVHKPYTADISAAASLMPEGWLIVSDQEEPDNWCAFALKYRRGASLKEEVRAPTEPQARAALALLCVAAELEGAEK